MGEFIEEGLAFLEFVVFALLVEIVVLVLQIGHGLLLVLDHPLEEVGQHGLLLLLVAEQVDGHDSAIDLAQSAEVQVEGIFCEGLAPLNGHASL